MKDNITTEAASEETEQPKIEKKKLLVISPRASEGSSYSFSYNSMNFAFVSDEEHKRTQCTSFLTCREYINRCVLSHIVENKAGGNYSYGVDAPIDTNKLRLLIATGPYDAPSEHITKFKQNLFNAKAGINRYEELVGWKRSVICTVKHKACKGHVWMITAPGEWISQPQLLSTFVLLLRFICLHPKIDTTSIESIHSSMVNLAVKYNKDKESPSSRFVSDSDLEFRFGDINTIHRYAFLIKNAGELFKDIDLKKAWPTSANDSVFTMSSGVDRFVAKDEVNYSDTIKLLQKAFRDMWDKYNVPNKEALKEVS